MERVRRDGRVQINLWLDPQLNKEIRELAARERRAITRQIEILLERAMDAELN